jgi:enamine deaminase RidA (YjgF/YER057c/UK114 family)
MRFRTIILLFALAGLIQAKKKDHAESTQTLREPKDLPAITQADAARLRFHLSPLSAKGLLSQQTRDALAALIKASGGATIVHLRAFVAGSGDLRRIQQLTSEVFTKKNLPLPSLSVLQVGALPLTGAQIEIEAIAEIRKEPRKSTAPEGVAFIPLQDSPEQLAQKATAALAITCYTDDAAKAPAIQSTLAAKFPAAVIDVVQTQRLPPRPVNACEAVAPGPRRGKIAFSGTQAAFGFEEKDATLAFQRIARELTAAGLTPADVIETRVYALTRPIGEMARKARTTPSEASAIPVEGVAGSDASFAIDIIAARP